MICVVYGMFFNIKTFNTVSFRCVEAFVETSPKLKMLKQQLLISMDNTSIHLNWCLIMTCVNVKDIIHNK